MREKLEKLVEELRTLESQTWETEEFDPILLHEALGKLEDALAGKRGSDEGDSDRGVRAWAFGPYSIAGH